MTARTSMLAVVVTVVIASAVDAQDVRTDWDRTINFATYRTYAWVPDNSLTGNTLLDGRIVNAIDTQLFSKGLRRRDHAGDVLLAAHVATRDRATLNGFYANWAPGTDWSGVGTMGIVSELSQGTLIVDIVDARTRKLVWRGAATSSISNNPEKSDKKINKALEKMFKEYPAAAADSGTGVSTTESFLVGTYGGTLPCADCAGVGTELTLYADSRLQGEGTFVLAEEYLGTRDGDRSVETRGRWTVVRGTPADPDVTFYKLNASNAERTLYFVRAGEDALRMLDREQREIPLQGNYTLKRVPARRVGGPLM